MTNRNRCKAVVLAAVVSVSLQLLAGCSNSSGGETDHSKDPPQMQQLRKQKRDG